MSKQVTDGSRIGSSVFSLGIGGTVNVTTDSLLIDGTGVKATGIFAAGRPGSSGNGGNIAVQARVVKLIAGGQISSSPFGGGDGGTVEVIADSLLIGGAGSGIFADAGGSGNGGNVSVGASDLTITAGGAIASNTKIGNGGGVLVEADSLVIDGVGSDLISTGVFAEAVGGSGRGGEVAVFGGSLMLQNEGAISAASSTSGAAGSINLSLGTLSVNSASLISSANTGSGEAGNVFINTIGPVNLTHGSSISASAKFGNAGSIGLSSGGEIKLKDQSSITASAGVNGGNIHITAPELVYLIDSSIIATAGSTGKSGTGGNIRIDPRFIGANNSLISANATLGTDGNVELISDFLFISNSQIFATGTVNITAPALDLGGRADHAPGFITKCPEPVAGALHGVITGRF